MGSICSPDRKSDSPAAVVKASEEGRWDDSGGGGATFILPGDGNAAATLEAGTLVGAGTLSLPGELG